MNASSEEVAAWIDNANCEKTDGHVNNIGEASLFEGHQLSLDHLVRNLLKLYVEIEFTGSHTQFFDKFTIRHNIAELLEYLWNVPSHRNTWRQIAREEEKGVYLNFLNFLINDSIYLLDESLNKILELKEIEAEMADSAAWERRPAQIVRFDMKLANEDVGMLAFTSEQIPAPFLLPEMLFASTADILWKIGEDGRIIQEFVQLGVKAREAASEAMDAEAALGEIPDEFLDPIQTDPFSRSHLTQDMLIPNTELKLRIEEFIRSQALRMHSQGSSNTRAAEPADGVTDMEE
ncbi:hypothetical protein COCNU_13G006030 [Cocos nucifera]|uniref:Ubiquitin conjugation factor E4 n=1 Tax=Cocos nucifera TaxID=13894 RepID=A0A8K0NBK9_COCNU|nr:hypothetical protein COCNU_13G006030 [Cocos nucifera]